MKDIILPDIIATGIYNSRAIYKNNTVSKNRKTTMFEIEIPIESVGTSWIDELSEPVSINTIICAKPNQTRHTKLPFSCMYIHMQLNDGLLYDKICSLPNFIPITNHGYYYDLFQKIIKHYDRKLDSDYIYLQSIIMQLIYSLEKEASITEHKSYIKSGNKEIIEKIIKHIKNNLTEDLSLDAISDFCSLSPIYLHNVFKASTGRTLRDYVEEQRIKKSINLLTTTNSTLTEIAFECGFSSQSYFNSVFKRRMKQTPREYVRKVYEQYDL